LKKLTVWMMVISAVVFVIAWGVMGVKIYNGDYGFETEAYIGLVCLVVFTGSSLFSVFCCNRCPKCGRVRWVHGNYCANCGHQFEK